MRSVENRGWVEASPFKLLRWPIAVGTSACLAATIAFESNTSAYATTPEPTPPVGITDIASLDTTVIMPDEEDAAILQQQIADAEKIADAIGSSETDTMSITDISELGKELEEQRIVELDKALQNSNEALAAQPDGTLGDLTQATQQRSIYYQQEHGFKAVKDTSVYAFYSQVIDAVNEGDGYIKNEKAKSRVLNIAALLIAPPTDISKVSNLMEARSSKDKKLQASIDYYIKTMSASYQEQVFVEADDIYTKEQQAFFARAMAASDLDVLSEEQLRDLVSIGNDLPPPAEVATGPNTMVQALENMAKSNNAATKLQASIALQIAKNNPELTGYQIAAIIGNCVQESNCKSEVVNSIGATGIFQWLGPRKVDLYAFAKDRGKSPKNQQLQIDFLKHEFAGKENRAYRLFKATKNLASATTVFGEKFERAGAHEMNMPRRIQNAQKFHASLVKNMKPKSTCAGGTPTRIGEHADGTKFQLCKVGALEVRDTISAQVSNMLAHAKRDGINLGGSAYRSSLKQIQLREQNCDGDIWKKSPSACTPPTAIPGTSMHESGLAIDFTYNGSSIRSHSNAGFEWLGKNAGNYGLYNLPSEPWHWSTSGG